MCIRDRVKTLQKRGQKLQSRIVPRDVVALKTSFFQNRPIYYSFVHQIKLILLLVIAVLMKEIFQHPFTAVYY